MSKQIVYNNDNRSLYFKNDDQEYRIELHNFKETEERFNSNYILIQTLESSLFTLFTFDIEKEEKRFSTLKRAHAKIKDWVINDLMMSCNLDFDLKAKELWLDSRAKKFELVLIITNLTLSNLEFSGSLETTIKDLNKAEINSFGNTFFQKIQRGFTHFGYQLKMNHKGFHCKDVKDRKSVV
jgi:hypothetical protein